MQGGQAHTPEAIRQHMGGNICSCSAYPNIVTARTDAAIADAIFHATGKRVRDLPITIDRLRLT